MRSIKSLEKGLFVLDVVANYPDGARVRDIAERGEGKVSNITLYLDSLVNAGFVRKDGKAGRYFITQKISDIARKAEQNQNSLLKQVALPELHKLSSELDENVLLAVLEWHDIHFIERIQSTRSVQIRVDADIHFPPHVTAAGKAILAAFPDAAREKYLDDALYHQFTDKSLVNPNSVRQQLMKIREEGYAVNYGEYESEIMAVAGPIRVRGVVLGSVVVQFPTFCYQEAALPTFGKRITEAAQAVAGLMEAPSGTGGSKDEGTRHRRAAAAVR